MALLLRPGFMLDAFGHHKHLTGRQRDRAISELDGQLPIQHDKDFIRIGVLMPHKVALDFDQFELVMIHLSDNLGGPLIAEFSQLFLKIEWGVVHRRGLLNIEVALEVVFKGNEGDKVSPAQLSCQWYDNFVIRKHFAN